ncbi:MAG: hypothetical protein IJI14_05470 [Anaerolineaceae bacterium]|nr:hypothetical protein [Anaerolineaceae bacterium]
MKEKDPSKVSWKQMFLFTRDGNLQNMDFMYAFFLGIILLFADFIISNRLTMLFESLFPSFSRGAKNALDIAVPAALCAGAAALLFHLIRKKKIVLMACIMALLITLVFLTAMLFMYDKETMEILLPSFVGIFIVPALAAAVTVGLLYRRWLAKNPDPRREEERELEQRSE